MLGYEQQFSRSTPGACFGVVGEEFIAYACNITFGSNKNEIQQRCPTAMVFYGQDTGCKLQENHDELGVLLPLNLNITSCTISSRWTALCCAVVRR